MSNFTLGMSFLSQIDIASKKWVFSPQKHQEPINIPV